MTMNSKEACKPLYEHMVIIKYYYIFFLTDQSSGWQVDSALRLTVLRACPQGESNVFLALRKAQTEILWEAVNEESLRLFQFYQGWVAGPFAALTLISKSHTQISNFEWAAKKAVSRPSVAQGALHPWLPWCVTLSLEFGSQSRKPEAAPLERPAQKIPSSLARRLGVEREDTHDV